MNEEFCSEISLGGFLAHPAACDYIPSLSVSHTQWNSLLTELSSGKVADRLSLCRGKIIKRSLTNPQIHIYHHHPAVNSPG